MSDLPYGPRIGSLCTGYGGLELAVELVLGGQLAWYAETDRHAQTVLARHWPDMPNLGDIRTVNWASVTPVDVSPPGSPAKIIPSDQLSRKLAVGCVLPGARVVVVGDN